MKDSVTVLQSENTNITDCYLHLVKLAVSIKRNSINTNSSFKKFCDSKFNLRWKEFNHEGYLLAYFLHPGYKVIVIKYGQFQNIAEIAATYWKSMQKSKKTCTELLSQLRKYRLQQRPYNAAYNNQYYNPLSWWYTCEDNYDHLQQLAIKLFSVVPPVVGVNAFFQIWGDFMEKIIKI